MEEFEILDFRNYLLSKGLSEITITNYFLYFDKLIKIMDAMGKDFVWNQEFVNSFVSSYNCLIARAFFKHYLAYKKLRDFEIPKYTGRKMKREITLIPPAHYEKIRDILYKRKVKYGLMLDLTYHLALRRSEIVNIRFQDFNFLEKADDPNAPFTLRVIGKGNKERIVVLPKSQEDLMELLFVYITSNNLTPEDKLFKMSRIGWWKIFAKACIDAGYYKFDSEGRKVRLYHPHSLRHTKSTFWSDAGIGIEKIQKRLGHESIATTRLYINTDSKKDLEIWNKE